MVLFSNKLIRPTEIPVARANPKAVLKRPAASASMLDAADIPEGEETEAGNEAAALKDIDPNLDSAEKKVETQYTLNPI